MINIIKILLLILSILLISCSKEEKISIIEEKNIEDQMIDSFIEGYDESNKPIWNTYDMLRSDY